MEKDGHNRSVEGVLATLAGASAWGLSGTCVQFLFSQTSLNPLVITTLRQLGAAIPFLLLSLATQREALKGLLSCRETRLRLLIFGSFGLFLNSMLYSTAIAYTNAGTATVLQSLSIVFVLAITCTQGHRKPRSLELVALACALAAVFLIATHADPSSLYLPPLGLAFGIATAAAATFYTMYPKPLFERWGSLPVTSVGMLTGGLTGLVGCLATGNLPTLTSCMSGAMGTSGLLVLLISTLIGTFAAYGLYLHGISIVGPLWGNMLGAAEPVSATVISAIWLHTSFSPSDWAGLALMVVTIVLVSLQSERG